MKSPPAVTLGILIRAVCPAFKAGMVTEPDAAINPISGSIFAVIAGVPEPAGPMHSTISSSELAARLKDAAGIVGYVRSPNQRRPRLWSEGTI